MRPAPFWRALLAVVAASSWSITAQAEQDVKFTTDANFTVKPLASGIVSRTSDGLSLLLYDVVLATDSADLVTPKSFRVGVAFEDPAIGRWNVSHWSPYIDINSSFDATGTLEIKRVAVDIATADTPLEGRWLLIEVRYVSKRLNGVMASSYAHSSRTIFDGQRY